MRSLPQATTTTAPRRSHPARAEQETIIRWDREEPTVSVWSASPVVCRKMDRLGLAPVRESTSYGQLTGRWYRVPLARFRWGLKRRGTGTVRPLGPRLAGQTAL
jgi:hypothetical protein